MANQSRVTGNDIIQLGLSATGLTTVTSFADGDRRGRGIKSVAF